MRAMVLTDSAVLARGVMLVTLLLAAGAGAAHAQEPRARIELRDAGPVMVSAGARVAVDVLVPTFFNGPIQFPDEIELEGAIVILAPGSSVNLNERIDGANWAGVRRTYRVYPLAPGAVTIDALPVTISYALDSGGSSGPTVVRTPPLELTAYVPEPARQLAQFFAADAFRLEATTVAEAATAAGTAAGSTTIRVGETVTRSYTMEATNTPGLFLPSLSFPAIEGASAYAAQPDLRESGGQRGSARTATRVEGVTYTFEQEGQYEIPGVTINWWDVAGGQLRQEQTPPVSVTVVPNPDLDAAMLETDEAEVVEVPRERRWVTFLRAYWRYLAAGLVFLVLARRLLPARIRRLRAWQAARRLADRESEARYFRAFVAVSRTGDARQVYNAMTRWLDRWSDDTTPTLAAFAARHGTLDLQQQVAALADAAFGDGSGGWSGQALARGVETARRGDAGAATQQPALAPLNPS